MSGTPPASPGEAFWDAYRTAHPYLATQDTSPYAELEESHKTAISAGAKAAITAGAPAELAAAMAETRALAGHLDLATRLMLDLGSDQLAASARRIRKAAGLEPA